MLVTIFTIIIVVCVVVSATKQEDPGPRHQTNRLTRHVFKEFENDLIALEDTVNRTEELHVTFGVSYTKLNTKTPRIESSSFGAPLTVIVRSFDGEVTSWLHHGDLNDTIGKTIWVNCSYRLERQADELTKDKVSFTLILSTTGASSSTFRVTIELIDDVLHFDKPRSVSLTPLTPFVWLFPLTQELDVKTVIVNVTSPNRNVCALVSIQPYYMKFKDDESNARFNSRWQTMLGQSIIDVPVRKEAFKDGFFVVILVQKSKMCLGTAVEEDSFRRKNFTVVIEKNIIEEDLLAGSLIIVVFYLLSCGAGVILALCFAVPLEGKYVTAVKQMASRTSGRLKSWKFRSHEAKDVEMVDRSRDIDTVDGGVMSVRREVDDIDGFQVSVIRDVMEEVSRIAKEVIVTSSGHDESQRSQCKQEVFETMIREHRKQSRLDCKERRSKEDLRLCDLALTVDKELNPGGTKLRSSLYRWIIVLISIFYTLPVLQLLLVNQRESLNEGNLDRCYYNFLCKPTTSFLEDYGHVFSNIAYVIGGTFFIIMTKIRQRRHIEYLHEVRKHKKESRNWQIGIPEQFGIFYAMGGSLAMEGVLSACYHICPTHVNFQFDTTFMYVIAVLIFLKVYQFRHPDVTSSAHSVFSVIGIALIMEVIGYYTNSIIFWIMFIGGYIVSITAFIIHTYYNGMFSMFRKSWKKILNDLKELNFSSLKPSSRRRFLLSSVAIAVNFGFAAYVGYKRRQGVSRYLLVILMVNMMLYVLFYFGMKFYYRWCFEPRKKNEGIGKTSVLYLFISIVFMIIGVGFFMAELKNSSLSPAQSRDLNGRCALLFFDNHDIWHFASATSLFFIFMMILTLEDENMNTPWSDIHVF